MDSCTPGYSTLLLKCLETLPRGRALRLKAHFPVRVSFIAEMINSGTQHSSLSPDRKRFVFNRRCRWSGEKTLVSGCTPAHTFTPTKNFSLSAHTGTHTHWYTYTHWYTHTHILSLGKSWSCLDFFFWDHLISHRFLILATISFKAQLPVSAEPQTPIWLLVWLLRECVTTKIPNTDAHTHTHTPPPSLYLCFQLQFC